MSRRNTDIGGDLNIVKNSIRYYRELNHYSYQEVISKQQSLIIAVTISIYQYLARLLNQ